MEDVVPKVDTMDTENQVTSSLEELARLQEEVKSLGNELKQLESEIVQRKERAKLLSEPTKEKLSKLRSKKRKRDGTGGDDRVGKTQRGEAGVVPEKPLCSRPLVVNKAGSVRTVRRVLVKNPQPVLPAPLWTRRSVARKNEESVCLAEFSLKVELMQHHWGWPFLKPVDPVALNLPDYFTVIKKPMDLGTVKNNLLEIQYTHFKDFVEDVRLVWKNCMTYNGPAMDIHAMALSLSNLFEEKIKPLARFLEKDTPLCSRKYLQQQVNNLRQAQSKLQAQLQGLNKPTSSNGANPEIQTPIVRSREEVENKTRSRVGDSELTASNEMIARISKDVGKLELKYMKGLQTILQEDPHGNSVFAALTTTTTPVSIDVDQLQPITLYRIETYLEDCTVDRIKHAPLVKPKLPAKAVRKSPPARPPPKAVSSKTSMSHRPPPRPSKKVASESSDFSSISEDDISMEEERFGASPERPPIEKKVVKKVGIKVTGLGAGPSKQGSRPTSVTKSTPKLASAPPRDKPPAKPTPKPAPKPSQTPVRPKPTQNAARPSAAKPIASSTDKGAAGTELKTSSLSTSDTRPTQVSARKWSFDDEGGEGEEESVPSQPKPTVQTHTMGVIRKAAPPQAKPAAQPKTPQPVFSHHNIQRPKPAPQTPQPQQQQQRPVENVAPSPADMAAYMGMMSIQGYPNMMGMMPMMGGYPMNAQMMMQMQMGMGMGMPMGMGYQPPPPSGAPPGFVRSAPPPPTIRSAPPPTNTAKSTDIPADKPAGDNVTSEVANKVDSNMGAAANTNAT